MSPSLKRHVVCLTLLPLTLLLPTTTTAQHFPSNEELEGMLRYLVEDGETPGIVVGVLEADGSTRIVAYGDPGPDARPLGPRSVFEIGSINKTFTATLLADMVTRGEVTLDDPVARYLPDDVTMPAWGDREITPLDLATHTSGLPRLADNMPMANRRDPYADYTVQHLYDFLSGHELRREPGEQYEYSNMGFGLLGHVLARAAGTSYRELLRERILDPLGMTMTGYTLEGEVAEWMTRGHHFGRPVPFWFGTEAIEGAGGLRSNMEDMLKYLAANVGPPETELERAMRMAHEARAETGAAGSEVGLAWGRGTRGGPLLLRHSGGTGGFSTRIAFDPEKEVGIVVMANTTSYTDNLGISLLLLGQPRAFPEVELSPEALARYVGRYEFPSGSSLHVRLEGEGYLTVQGRGGVRQRMHAKSDTSFFVKQAPWSCAFQTDGSGQVVGLVYELDERDRSGAERTLTGRKVEDDSPPPAVVADNAGFGVTAYTTWARANYAVFLWGPKAWVLLAVLASAALTFLVALLRGAVGRKRRGGFEMRTSLLFASRWLARIPSAILVVVMVLFIIFKLVSDPQELLPSSPGESLGLLFGVVVLVGYVWGWKRERMGGAVVTIAAVAMAVSVGDVLALLWGIPGLLYLSAGALSPRDS